jgi:polysaccharide export outer membrane protein
MDCITPRLDSPNRCTRAVRARLCLGLIAFVAAAQLSVGAQSNDYVIGVQDVVLITVFDQGALSGNYTVEADGTLNFPLLGRVKAAGSTLRELESTLKKLLADGYLRHPQVTVAMQKYNSQRIFIMGDVRTPGPYPLTGNMTLIEALALAGVGSIGAGTDVIVVRPTQPKSVATLPGQDANAQVIRVNLKSLEKGELDQNVRLSDGDTIFVPRAETIYVFGQVKSPGAYGIRNDTTVLQALSLAGGLTEHAASGRIKIIRMADGKQKEIKVKFSDLVKAGDTIVVPERFF